MRIQIPIILALLLFSPCLAGAEGSGMLPSPAVLLERAVGAAQQMKMSNRKIELLTNLAMAQARAGQKHAAQETLQKALDATAAAHKDDYKYWHMVQHVLLRFASERLAAGDRDLALPCIERALNLARRSKDMRSLALRTVSFVQFQAGLYREAYNTGCGCKTHDEGCDPLEGTALEEGKKGNWDRAAAMADSIKNPAHRDEALSVVVDGRSETGDLEGALKNVPLIRDDFRQNGAYMGMAVASARRGDTARALSVISTMKENFPGQKSSTIWFAADERAKAGDVDGALRIAAAVLPDSPGGRHLVLRSVATHLRKQGDPRADEIFEGALDAAYAYSKNMQNDEHALASLAQSQAEARLLDDAHRTARRILDPLVRYKARQWVIEEQANQGFFGDAVAAAEKLCDPSDFECSFYNRNGSLAMIAREQARRGLVREAYATFRKIKGNPDERLRRVLAYAQAKAGDCEGASDLVKGMDGLYEKDKGEVLAEIAKARVENGDIERALEWAKSLSPMAQAMILSRLAEPAGGPDDDFVLKQDFRTGLSCPEYPHEPWRPG